MPYDTHLAGWLCLHNLPLSNLVNQSRRYERAYLAWETVRRTRNPFFNEGTGFEGYFVGFCQSADAMLTALVDIGHHMLEANRILYRHQYLFRTRLMKTLLGELNEPKALAVWSNLLGATLGQLRCHIYYNHQTYRFQNETYWTVNRLPFITYSQHDHHIGQQYLLAPYKCTGNARLQFALTLLKPSDYDAGLVVSQIGRFGHPLVRAYLREIS